MTVSTHKCWPIRQKDIKTYFHFDAMASRHQLLRWATDPDYVSRKAFFPLIRFKEEWTRFRKGGSKRIKSRPIRYCSRIDAAIFAYYRFRWSEHYEKYLRSSNIQHIPIAYRKIGKPKVGNKSNIEFARDVFDFIKNTGNCDVTVVDISSFFESLDHDLLREKLERVIGRDLTNDENSVLSAVTNYSVVDIDPLFERLGLFDPSTTDRRLRNIDQLRAAGHRRIIEPGRFNDLVCGGDPTLPSLIQRHRAKYGIPQGTPISDLLANIYMIDFDKRLARWVRKRNGFAYRYSDDVIVVLPTKNGQRYEIAFEYLQRSIENFGSKLKIKDSKVAVGRFIQLGDRSIYTQIRGQSCQNGIEYLGFQYDGQAVQLRNSTLSNAWRKAKRRAHGWAKSHVLRYRTKGDAWLRSSLNPEDKATEVLRTLTVRQAKEGDVTDWTFNSYVERAKNVFSDYANNFESQTKRYKRAISKMHVDALEDAIKRHGKRAFFVKTGRLL
ncbi:reverse transcriptase domain-containing protein [Oceaniradius stylonematis]|uniref:reverse transcriptase domain-containing protein n=1 Tax=Oceaniradius stylonematis TaxID=2184161 RepID=UPI003C7B9761